MYKLAVFDMDGTILNSIDDLADSCNHALAEFGYPAHEASEYFYFCGNGARMLVKRAMPESEREDDAQVDRVLATYSEWYNAHSAIKTAPYPGLVETLKRLKQNGVSLAVVSNKPDAATRSLAGLYFDGLFDVVFGQREGVPIKPAPDAVFEAMELLGVSPAETAYFGDSGVDISTGKNAGVFTTGVLWGFRPKSELESAGADRTIERPEEIADVVLNG